MTLSLRSMAARALIAAVALSPAAVAAQQSRGTVRTSGPTALGIHGFSVVLVVGSLTGTTAASSEAVPEAAKKALADMKDFLPYKRYQLLDAAWMLCCASPRAGVSGRVRGPDERDYQYHVDPIGVSDSKLDVRFTIREMRELPGARTGRTALHPEELEYSRRMAAAIHAREDAERALHAAQELHRRGLVSASDLESKTARSRQAEQRVKDVRLGGGAQSAQGTSGQNVIDSTFSISLGETVVVGTSRLHGDRALIAILTAAAKPTAAR